MKLAELNINIVTVFFRYTDFKDGLIEYKSHVVTKINKI